MNILLLVVQDTLDHIFKLKNKNKIFVIDKTKNV